MTATVSYGSVVVQRDVMVPMRDGVRLATDVYLPSPDSVAPAPGRFAVLLSRTPYSKSRPGFNGRAGAEDQALRGVRNGFAVAIQDTRGRYQSEGSFRSMQDDGPDGWDTLEWLGQQPWCNGRVGMYGVSYLGAVQMMLAPLHPPLLTSAFSEQPASDEFTDRTFHAGALTLQNVEGWAVNSSGEQYNLRLANPLRAQAEQELAQYRALGPQALELLPLVDVPWLRLIPGIWREVLDRLEDPTYFAANDIRSKLQDIDIPIYHLGGWFDPFLRNTIDHYTGALRANPDQRLILGPWTHGGMVERTFPDGAFDDFGYALAWHDRWLRDAAQLAAQQAPAIVYVMGANRWRAEEAWPLPGTVQTSYFLRAGGVLLAAEPGAAEPPDTYRYDPQDPLPSPPMGRTNVTSLLGRRDTLLYTTPPLDEPVEVTGEIAATLYAASSASDTDWMLRVVDITPGGEALHVVDGIMRARYRHSRTAPAPLTPGAVERYDINLWATSLVFERGHQIGLVVSSSNFPKYDRHPNVYADLRRTTEADFVAALQTVHHSSRYPSAVHLPIIPASRERNWIANPMPL
jgi:putative CocE/NonD family hydrolase